MRMRRLTFALASSALCIGVRASAQCADGTRPPCDRPRPVELPTPTYRQVTTSGRSHSPALTSDGKLLAFIDRGVPVVVRLVVGATAVPVLSASDRRRVGAVDRIWWTADGSSLFLFGDSGTHLVAFPGGQPRRVVEREHGQVQTTPRGDRAVSWGVARKYSLIHDLSSGAIDTLRILGRYDWLQDFLWAPDGRTLVSLTTRGSNEQMLQRHDPRTGAASIVFVDSVPLELIAWPGGDNAIYYARGGVLTPYGRRGGQLRRLRADARPITKPEIVDAELPSAEISIASDGSVATMRPTTSSNVFLTGIGGDTARTWLTRGTVVRERPRFSPSGSNVAFLEHDGVAANVVLVDTSGARRQITSFQDELVTDYAWSPSGRQMAVCVRGNRGHRLGVVDVVSGTIRWPGSAPLSQNCNLGWVSDTVVAYLKPGNRNFVLQSLTSGSSRLLIEGDTTGFVFDLVAPPRGTPILVFRNRRDGRGTWQFSDSGHRVVRLGLFPLRLNDAGTMFAYEMDMGGRGLYYRLNITTPDSLVLLANIPRCVLGDVSPDGTRIACAETTVSTDIWLMRPARTQGRP